MSLHIKVPLSGDLNRVMFTENQMVEFEFPWPDESKGYSLFSPEMESDPLILFHATSKKNLRAIQEEGFKSFPPLASVSYAKNSTYCLAHLFSSCHKLKEEAVVIVVRFENLQQQGIKEELSVVHVYKSNLQPTIVGYCTIPVTYVHK